MDTDQVMWRIGNHMPINVYEGDRPICQCHTPEDAARIVAAVNGAETVQHSGKEALELLRRELIAACTTGGAEDIPSARTV